MIYLLLLACKIQFFLFYDCIFFMALQSTTEIYPHISHTVYMIHAYLYIKLSWLAYFQHCKWNKTFLQVLSYLNALCVVMFLVLFSWLTKHGQMQCSPP